MNSRLLLLIVLGASALFLGVMIAISSGDSHGFAFQLSAFTQGVVQSESVGSAMWACFIVSVVVLGILFASRPLKQVVGVVAIAFLWAWLISSYVWAVGKDLENLETLTLGKVLRNLPETALGVLLITFIAAVLALLLSLVLRFLSNRRCARDGHAAPTRE